MRQTLNGMRKRGSEDRGFTMIELLVVVVIIGVLVAIAVPVYLNYRKGAANKTAESDVRAAITAVEQYYSSNVSSYPPDATALEGDPLVLGSERANASPGNTLGYNNRDNGTYVICAVNKDGKKYYKYDSAVGGSVKEAGDAITTMAACLA